jgi:hypothetical protein
LMRETKFFLLLIKRSSFTGRYFIIIALINFI